MTVTLHVADQIATITLNRPEKRNALSQAMLAELERLADSLRGAGDVRAVVLGGEGTDFSVGADIGEMEGRLAAPASLTEARRAAQLGARVMRAVQGIDQPTICALKGVATGG
uniref:enoyl-CoA hydratase/isomerase family protein n=1 Tax=Sandarakinorhabdus sp. TaxID=1916663 RepID=UPI00286D6E84